VPQKVSNVLVVGKSTAAGVHLRQAHGVLFQGQAAGIAAAMAAKDGVAMARIDIGKLQAALKSGGVTIPY
jgi:FAD dependent oxidoreductase